MFPEVTGAMVLLEAYPSSRTGVEAALEEALGRTTHLSATASDDPFDGITPTQLDAAAHSISRFARGYNARAHYKRVRRMAIRLQAKARTMKERKAFKVKKLSAVTIQRHHHKRVARDPRTRNHADVRLVYQLIQALQDGNMSVFRTCVTDDFVFDRAVRGHQLLLNSLAEFLRSPLSRRKQPRPSKVFADLHVIPTGIDNKHTSVVVREVKLATIEVHEHFTVTRTGRSKRPCVECHRVTLRDDKGGGSQHLLPRRREPLQCAQLRESFSFLDVDQSGSLSVDEVVAATRLIGLPFNKHDVRDRATQDHAHIPACLLCVLPCSVHD